MEKINGLLDQFASLLNFNEDEAEQLKSSFLLHDIGNIAIVDNILNKPESLSQTEWMEVKRHPEIGYRILSSVSEYSKISEAILAHHENWDGSGYPKGLKGKEIPFMARVLSIFDSYEAMTSERPYRKALTHDDALKEIIHNSGTRFDPHLVRIFVQQLF
jgi:HD-GYP domain-containing protein (c-di-GMP phosphodiesterase class II)